MSRTRSYPVKPPFWNNPQTRAIAFQVIALTPPLSCLAGISSRTPNPTCAAWASPPASVSSILVLGFDIVQTLIPYSSKSSYGRVFWVALLNTLLVSALGIVLATLLGFMVGYCPLVEELAGFPVGPGLYRDLSQYSAVAANFLLVFRRAAGDAGPAPEPAAWARRFI
jgi:ABC-type amino acid transport system permease subunit